MLHTQVVYLCGLAAVYVGAFALVDKSWLMPVPARTVQAALTIWFLFTVIRAVAPL